MCRLLCVLHRSLDLGVLCCPQPAALFPGAVDATFGKYAGLDTSRAALRSKAPPRFVSANLSRA